jgi:hypothetical protein
VVRHPAGSRLRAGAKKLTDEQLVRDLQRQRPAPWHARERLIETARLIDALEEFLGTRLAAPGRMTPDLFEVWTKRDPAGVRWHSRVEGSPRALIEFKRAVAVTRRAARTPEDAARIAATELKATQALQDLAKAARFDDPDAEFGAALRAAIKRDFDEYLDLRQRVDAYEKANGEPSPLRQDLHEAADSLVEQFRLAGLPGDSLERGPRPIDSVSDILRAFREVSPEEIERYWVRERPALPPPDRHLTMADREARRDARETLMTGNKVIIEPELIEAKLRAPSSVAEYVPEGYAAMVVERLEPAGGHDPVVNIFLRGLDG